MKVLVRHIVLILFVWLVLVGVCLGKQVYLKDGGIIDSQSAWRKGDKVLVQVNRDILAEFNPNEIDLKRTFPKSGSAAHHRQRKAVAAAVTTPAPAKAAAAPAVAPQAAKPAAPPTPAVQTPAPAPATPPAATPAPTTAEPTQPAAATTAAGESGSPPDKAEQQRRAQEAAKMMTEALLKKDPELMKKALAMQKSALPQQGASAQRGFPVSILLAFLAACLMIIAGHWIVFQKAGQAGWKCLIPFYNMYVLMEISGKPGWWMFLMFIPLIGIVVYLFAMLSLARKFGRSELFGIGLFFLPMIFFPVLAFGGSEYQG